ncbi:hypothetical protein WJX73_003537 [Symbiochloris irregularis]|uniref:Uncharacterized protein n=1 Tax=Symbiochloris irregularis TaxID=706552 RepID=A0AAW1PBE4_9CHLO
MNETSPADAPLPEQTEQGSKAADDTPRNVGKAEGDLLVSSSEELLKQRSGKRRRIAQEGVVDQLSQSSFGFVSQAAAVAGAAAGSPVAALHTSAAAYLSADQTLEHLSTEELRAMFPRVHKHLPAMVADMLLRESSGKSLWTWNHEFLFDRYKDVVTGLQGISQRSEASPAHAQADVMEELKAAAAVQRKMFLLVVAAEDPAQEASVRSAILHTTTHNLDQPWPLVQQIHEDMLANAGLLPQQAQELGSIAGQALSVLERAAAERTRVKHDLQMAMQMEGPLMQRRSRQWSQSQDLVGRLQQLQDAEDSARYSIWRWVATNEMLDTGRLALLQLPSELNILPDMVLMGSLLLKQLRRLDSPQRALSGTPPQGDGTNAAAGQNRDDESQPNACEAPSDESGIGRHHTPEQSSGLVMRSAPQAEHSLESLSARPASL